MTIVGFKGGYNVIAGNNRSLNNYKITASCYVDVQNSNVNFSTINWQGSTLVGGRYDTSAPCTGNRNIAPSVSWVTPLTDTLIQFDSLVAHPSFIVTVKSGGGNLATQLANIYANNVKVASRLTINQSDSTTSFLWNIPPTPNAHYVLSGEIWDTVSRVHSFSLVRNVQVIKPLGIGKNYEQLSLNVYPNPVNTGSVSIQRNTTMPATMRLTDITGHEISNTTVMEGQQTVQLSGLTLPAGIYLLHYADGLTQRTYKLVFK